MKSQVMHVSKRKFRSTRGYVCTFAGGGTLFLFLVCATHVSAVPIPPNDASVSANLLVWLTDPANTYNEIDGVWADSSGNANDAAIFTGVANGALEFEPLILSEETGEFGLMEGQAFDTVMTTDLPDMLKTPHLNDENGFSELTIITLLRYSDRNALNRPVGVGAFNDEDLRTHYNLAVDGSIRRDDGFTAGTEPTPDDFFVRGSVLSGDGFDNASIRDFYFDDYGSGFEAFVNMDDEDFAAIETGDDRLYIGDLRENYFDNAIAQVAFYNAALSDEQVEAIAEWIVENPNGTAAGGQPALKAGDANMDYQFNQLDLVQVQIAAKYLSGTAATWGEGDWDGAPGGEPGSPPAGDGEFNQLDIISALAAGTYLTGPYAAVRLGGQAGDGQTSIVYDPGTGEFAVDAPAGVELTSINIDSAAGVFTGDAAANLGGSFDNDSDDNIFKATFGSSFGSISFGNVAQSGLSEQFVLSDLLVVGSLAGGGALGDVDLIYVPEPSSCFLLLLGASLLVWRRRR